MNIEQTIKEDCLPVNTRVMLARLYELLDELWSKLYESDLTSKDIRKEGRP